MSIFGGTGNDGAIDIPTLPDQSTAADDQYVAIFNPATGRHEKISRAAFHAGLSAEARGLTPTTVKTSNYTAAVGELVLCDTSGESFTITFPNTAEDGDLIGVIDVAGMFSSNPVSILPDVLTIAEGADAVTLDVDKMYVELVYVAAETDWKFKIVPSPDDLANHEASLDPHPQYLTQVDADALYRGFIKEKLDGTIAPTINDDSGDGYAVGSRWINVEAGKEYVCVDAAVGAAVWVETTASGGGGAVDSVNGQTGDVTLAAADVGADPTGTAAAAIAAHVAASDPHTQYLTQSEADALYVAAGGSSGGNEGGVTVFQLSGPPRTVSANEEVTISHSTISNARALPVVMMQQTPSLDVTNISIDYDAADESNYVQQNSMKTDFDGQIKLQNSDSGGIFSVSFNGDANSAYGQAGSLPNGGSYSGSELVLNGSSTYVTWNDFPELPSGTEPFCMELLVTPTSYPGGRVALLWQSNGGGTQPKWFFYIVYDGAGNGALCLHTNGPGYPNIDVGSNWTPFALNQEHHCVLQRKANGHLELFLDGQLLTWSYSSGILYYDYGANNWPDSVSTLYAFPPGDHMQSFFAGRCDAIRIRKGSGFSLYTNGYTPPTSDFPGPTYDTASSGWFVKTGENLRINLTAVDQIDSVTITETKPSNTQIKYLVSFDGGTTWKSNTGSGFTTVSDIGAIAGGMTATQLQAAFNALDTEPYASLDFLACLQSSSSNTTPSVSLISVQYDEKASYCPAVLGGYSSSKSEFGVKHFSGGTKLKNLTGSSQAIIAYVVEF